MALDPGGIRSGRKRKRHSLHHHVPLLHATSRVSLSLLMELPYAQAIWRRILRLSDRLLMQGMLTWRNAIWTALNNTVAIYEGSSERVALVIIEGNISPWPLHPFSEQSFSDNDSSILDLISGAMLWAIWKNRCKRVF